MLDLRKRCLDGDDPLAVKREAKARDQLANAKMMRFGECAEAYIAADRDGWKDAVHAQQLPSTLQTYVYPVIGDLSVQAVDTALVMKILEPIWKTKPQTAGWVRGRIESVLDWAVRGYRQGENPARWRGHIKNLLPPISKVHRVAHEDGKGAPRATDGCVNGNPQEIAPQPRRRFHLNNPLL